MQNKGLQRATYIFGISMALLMAISLIGPAFTRNRSRTTQPTAVPETPTPLPPTLPPPMTDFNGISFDIDYLHPSGLFSVAVPTGWVPTEPGTTATQVKAVLNHPEALSVIEVALEKPTTPVTNMEELNAHFTPAMLQSSWRRYLGGYAELSRTIEGDRSLIDFALTDSQERDFLARQVAWLEGEWIYSVRVVVPNNSRELLFYMLDAMTEQITVYPRFMDTPVNWEAFYDEIDHHIIRRPSSWRQTDGDSGQVVSFESGAFGGVQMLVESQADLIEDERAARDWVANLNSTVEVFSVVPVTRVGGEGFSVAYGMTNPDGEGISGLAVLLKGEDEKLHIANVQIMAGEVDLNGDEALESYDTVVQAMDTFSLLTTLRLPVVADEADTEDATG